VIDARAISFRPATPRDAARIAALLTDEGYPAGDSDIAARLARFAGPAAGVIVAESGGEVLGFVATVILPRFEQDGSFVRIVALVVDPGVRERGLGRLLIAEAERVGRDVGADFVEITAGHHRPEARRLYESVGFDASVTAYLRKRL
jgi:GNAT superfamily N-acetyltransferase